MFFSNVLSPNGHNDSSWWQNTMFSNIGFDIPKNCGTCFSIYAHWWFMVSYYPFYPFVLRTCSIDSNLVVLPLADSCIRLFAKIALLPVLNIRRISPITYGLPATLGSIIKVFPLSLFGGKAPVVMYLRH